MIFNSFLFFYSINGFKIQSEQGCEDKYELCKFNPMFYNNCWTPYVQRVCRQTCGMCRERMRICQDSSPKCKIYSCQNQEIINLCPHTCKLQGFMVPTCSVATTPKTTTTTTTTTSISLIKAAFTPKPRLITNDEAQCTDRAAEHPGFCEYWKIKNMVRTPT